MAHCNFMNGISFYPENPLKKLELELYSCFLQEPRFYAATKENFNNQFPTELQNYILFPDNQKKTWQTIFQENVTKALNYDFNGTLRIAVKARKEYHMRNSPCYLLAIAAGHPERVAFNQKHPMVFRNVVEEVCVLPSDMIAILDAWKDLYGSKSRFPSCLKRAFQKTLVRLTPYQANKYRRACIDVIRLSHPPQRSLLTELMTLGKVHVAEKDLPWETLMSRYGCWKKTLEILEWKMPHMAALRNIRGFAIQVRDQELISKYCNMLEQGVLSGKQFPFRYWAAYQSLLNKTHKPGGKPIVYRKRIRKTDMVLVQKCLESCLQISIKNHPQLKGSVIALSDNSGSAWEQFQSAYGTMTVAEIGNLSALITAYSCSEKGVVGLFGDVLLEYIVDKNISLLENFQKIQDLVGDRGCNVGSATENGIWVFFQRAMKSPQDYFYNHFFCYSDMQAGHGGLFGKDVEEEWIWDGMSTNQMFIHVPKLVENYRKRINPKLNVFTIQTAGYQDSILPQSIYRGGYLHGWTGKEVLYAEKMNALWDEFDRM